MDTWYCSAMLPREVLEVTVALVGPEQPGGGTGPVEGTAESLPVGFRGEAYAWVKDKACRHRTCGRVERVPWQPPAP